MSSQSAGAQSPPPQGTRGSPGAPGEFVMTMPPPAWLILQLCTPQPGKTPAAFANVPKQPIPRDPDNSPIISGQSRACSLLGAHF